MSLSGLLWPPWWRPPQALPKPRRLWHPLPSPRRNPRNPPPHLPKSHRPPLNRTPRRHPSQKHPLKNPPPRPRRRSRPPSKIPHRKSRHPSKNPRQPKSPSPSPHPKNQRQQPELPSRTPSAGLRKTDKENTQWPRAPPARGARSLFHPVLIEELAVFLVLHQDVAGKPFRGKFDHL